MTTMKHGRYLIVIACSLVWSLSSTLWAEDQTAWEVLEELQANAKETNRPMLILIDNKNCGFCRRFNGILEQRRINRILDKKLDIVKLDSELPDVFKAMSEVKPLWGGFPMWWFVGVDGSCKVNSLYTTPEGEKTSMGIPTLESGIEQFISGVESVAELTPKERKKLKREWMEMTEHSRERILRKREEEAKEAS